MQCELTNRGLQFTARQKIPLTYKGLALDTAFEVDLLVENLIVVELKAVRELAPVHDAQLLTYLKLTGAPVGLLINFNVALLRDGGIRRLVNPRHELVNEFNPVQRERHSP